MLNLIDKSATQCLRKRLLPALAALFMTALVPPAGALAQGAAQTVFPTPKAAVEGLIAATKGSDPKAAASAILGPDAADVLSSGDAVADDNARKNFVNKYAEMHRLAYDADGRVILYLGADNWPFPIPLVKQDKGWVFDTAAGEKELVYRRIGANELYTLAVLENLVDAQSEYASEVRDESGVTHYALKILSDPGKRNGLYWHAAAEEPESPIGPLIAAAAAYGYKRGEQGQPLPFHGYVYRVLTGQGKGATGGAMNYLVGGRMTRGFAFLAYPVEYRVSGVMTFMVDQDGVVLQKDLGPDTIKIAHGMTRFDPDDTWEIAEPEPEEKHSQPSQPAANAGSAPAQR